MPDDDWKTLRVRTSAWTEAKAQKENADRTWSEQIVRPDSDDSSVPDGLSDMGDVFDELEKMIELLEKNPEWTADKVEERLR